MGAGGLSTPVLNVAVRPVDEVAHRSILGTTTV
jgi:hypothetical protein